MLAEAPLSACVLAPDTQWLAGQGFLGLGATEEAPVALHFPGFGQMTSPGSKLSSAGFGTAMHKGAAVVRYY